MAIVYEPMIGGDDREAAVAAARDFDDPRARCFWDGDRTSGRTWGAFDRDRLQPQILALIPPGSPWHERLVNWDPESQPLWDVAWFFGRATTWPASGLPSAAAWAKQFDFRVEGGQTSGEFFRGEGEGVDVASSRWHDQFEQGMAAAER